jgi:hypothetical protein
MAFTMACPNFKKGLKMAFGPLGVNNIYHSCHFDMAAFSTILLKVQACELCVLVNWYKSFIFFFYMHK